MKTETNKPKMSGLTKLLIPAIAGLSLLSSSCKDNYTVETKVIGTTLDEGPRQVIYQNLETDQQYGVQGQLSDTLQLGDYFKVEVNPSILGDSYEVLGRTKK